MARAAPCGCPTLTASRQTQPKACSGRLWSPPQRLREAEGWDTRPLQHEHGHSHGHASHRHGHWHGTGHGHAHGPPSDEEAADDAAARAACSAASAFLFFSAASFASMTYSSRQAYDRAWASSRGATSRVARGKCPTSGPEVSSCSCDTVAGVFCFKGKKPTENPRVRGRPRRAMARQAQE